jgi:RNA recognition motif-containing protein
MTSKLYVANLPAETTEHALRSHFQACGAVFDVELLYQRGTGKPRNVACVTMSNAQNATEALARLDGAPFEGRALRVTSSPPGTKPVRTVTIKQQFRERGHMTYDLDCAGVPLTLRIFPEGEGDEWRIEARSTEAEDAVVLSSSGTVRRTVLQELVRTWNARPGVSPLDGVALLEAMTEVRAI